MRLSRVPYKNGIKYTMENERSADVNKTSESKKLSFLETWQRRLGLGVEISSEEDKESKQEDGANTRESARLKKNKKWQSFFSKVFGGIVKPGSVEQTPSRAEGVIFEKGDIARNDQRPDELYIQPAQSEGAETDDPSQKTLTVDTPSQSPDHNNNAEDLENTRQPDEEDHPIPRTGLGRAYPTNKHGRSSAESNIIAAGLQPSDIEIPIYQQDQQANFAPTIAKPETHNRVIEKSERGVAVAAGLFGFEFFARRRADRKLRNEIKLMAKEKKPVRPTEVSAIVAPEASKSTDVLPSSGRISEKDLVARETKPLRDEEIRTTEVMERKDSYKTETAPQFFANEQTKPAAERADELLKEVAQAAEKNDPIEKLYERRHEVKDEPSNHLGAAPVGLILSRSHIANKGNFSVATQRLLESKNNSELAHKQARPQVYKQAITSGFWAGFIFIVFVGVIMIIRS